MEAHTLLIGSVQDWSNITVFFVNYIISYSSVAVIANTRLVGNGDRAYQDG